MTGNIRIVGRHTRGNGLLERLTIERKRFVGYVQSLAREIYDPADGAAILRHDPSRSGVVLVRRYRLPAFLRRSHESLNEVRAGMLEGEDADSRISKEAEKKTGFLVRNPRRVFEAYMNPGSFGEKLTFFVAQYTAGDRTGKGGGLAGDGEDIEILEPTLDDALAMIGTGEIIDAKTILLRKTEES